MICEGLYIEEGLGQIKSTSIERVFRNSLKNRLAIHGGKIYNGNNLLRNGGGEEMKRSIFVRVQWLEVLYFCRAIFHDVVFNGMSLPFFSNCIMKIER